MATASVCVPCSRRDKTSPASRLCTDCDEKLCSECVDVHRSFKAFLTHHVLSLSLAKDTSFNIKRFCTKHTELTYELFCPDHDVLCCRACMAENHRNCDKLAPIEIASKGVKSSSMFDNISKRVAHLTEAGHQFTEEMKKIALDLTQSKDSALEKVSGLKEELHMRIDEIYDASVSKINETYSSLIQKTKKNETPIKQKVQNIKEIAEKFKTVSKHGSEGQIFLLMNLLKFDIITAEEDFEKNVSSLKSLAVNYVESDILSLMQSLGSVTIQEQNSSTIQYEPAENQGAQINSPSQFVPATIQLDKFVSYRYDKDITITGMCVTRDGRLILCNNCGTSKDLLMLTCAGQYVRSLKLEYSPWNITIEPETGDAWVTMPKASFVQIVDTKSMSLQRRVNAVKNAYGIAFTGINLAVGTNGTVLIFNKQGSHVKTIQCHAEYINSLCYKDNMLYCADTFYNKLLGLRDDGTSVFTYKYADFRGPKCIISDSIGNLYVLCNISKNLHKLTADGKLVNVMLDYKTITNTAYAAVFTENFTKLFIASRDMKNIYIFSCK